VATCCSRSVEKKKKDKMNTGMERQSRIFQTNSGQKGSATGVDDYANAAETGGAGPAMVSRNSYP